MSVRLIRRTIGTSNDGRRFWEIDGTALIVVVRGKGGWWIARDGGACESDRHDTDRWLADSRLDCVRFPSRGQALRAYEAVAALCPPPPRTPPDVKLRYLAAGRYEHPPTGMKVIRRPDRKWQIVKPDGEPIGSANTLAIAASILDRRRGGR